MKKAWLMLQNRVNARLSGAPPSRTSR